MTKEMKSQSILAKVFFIGFITFCLIEPGFFTKLKDSLFLIFLAQICGQYTLNIPNKKTSIKTELKSLLKKAIIFAVFALPILLKIVKVSEYYIIIVFVSTWLASYLYYKKNTKTNLL